MANITFLRSIDIEETIRAALADYMTAYAPPLPEKFSTPCIEVTKAGGQDQNRVDTFDVVLDARATDEATADELLRNAVGVLRQIAKEQTTALRSVQVNTAGSWGADPVRPDLAMCSARLRVVAHQEPHTLNNII